jgi:hypothetical protein
MSVESLAGIRRDQLGHAHGRHNHMDAQRLAMLRLNMAILVGLLFIVAIRGEPTGSRVALSVQIGVAMVNLILFTVQVKRMVYTHRCKRWIRTLERELFEIDVNRSEADRDYGSYYWDPNLIPDRVGQYSVAFSLPFVNAIVPFLAGVGLGALVLQSAVVALLSLVIHLLAGIATYNAARSSPYNKTDNTSG